MTLRAPEPEDANIIYIWENSGADAHSSLRTGPLSRYQISRFIEEYDGEIYTLNALRYMIDVDGVTVGTIDVYDFEKRGRHAFVGIYVTPTARRRGYAAEALDRVERMMKKNVGMHSLCAIVASDNAASRRLFEKAGYEEAGKLRGWLTDGDGRIDAVLYQAVL